MKNTNITIPNLSVEIPEDIIILKVEETYVKAIRKDGLKIFFDRKTDKLSTWLNNVRIHGTRREVIMAVGFVRGMQIAANYADTYADDIDVSIEDFALPVIPSLVEKFATI